MYLNSKIIKSKALKLGFDKIGISKAEQNFKAKKNLEIWLSENKNADMGWIEIEKKIDIHKYYKDAKSKSRSNECHMIIKKISLFLL